MIPAQPSLSALVAAAVACCGKTSTYTRYPCFRAACISGEGASYDSTRSLTPNSRAGGKAGFVQCMKTLLHAHVETRTKTPRRAFSAIRRRVIRQS